MKTRIAICAVGLAATVLVPASAAFGRATGTWDAGGNIVWLSSSPDNIWYYGPGRLGSATHPEGARAILACTGYERQDRSSRVLVEPQGAGRIRFYARTGAATQLNDYGGQLAGYSGFEPEYSYTFFRARPSGLREQERQAEVRALSTGETLGYALFSLSESSPGYATVRVVQPGRFVDRDGNGFVTTAELGASLDELRHDVATDTAIPRSVSESLAAGKANARRLVGEGFIAQAYEQVVGMQAVVEGAKAAVAAKRREAAIQAARESQFRWLLFLGLGLCGSVIVFVIWRVRRTRPIPTGGDDS